MDKHLDAEALSDYAEGLADAAARAAADRHLADCAECRRELAAVRAYFRELSDLEPVAAPADFLAKVRARLPRPSPWGRAWRAILAPLRAVPIPIAAGILIGVTAITVHIRQGAMDSRATLPAPEPPAAQPQSLSRQVPMAEAPKARPAPSRMPKRKAAPPAAPSAASAPPPPAPGFLDAAPGASPEASDPGPLPWPPPPAEGRKAPTPSRPSRGEARNPETAELEDLPVRPSSGSLSGDAAPSPALPLDKAMPLDEGGAAPGQAEAAAGRAAAKKESRARPEGPARKDGPAPPEPLPGYAVSLRAAGDTAEVLAGLRAMGIEAAPESASPGERRYRLLVPAPMLRELGPYLSRHGASRTEGPPPAASGRALPFRLRLLFRAP